MTASIMKGCSLTGNPYFLIKIRNNANAEQVIFLRREPAGCWMEYEMGDSSTLRFVSILTDQKGVGPAKNDTAGADKIRKLMSLVSHNGHLTDPQGIDWRIVKSP